MKDPRERLLSQVLKAKAIKDPVERRKLLECALLDYDIRDTTQQRLAQTHADYVALCRNLEAGVES